VTALLAIRAFLRRLPWPVWAAIGLALALWGAWTLHKRSVASAYAQGAHDGAERAYARVEAKALDLKQQADATAAKIRSRTDEASRAVDTVTRTVLVRGPGAATCSNPAAPSTSGRVAPGGQAGPAVAPVPDGEGQQLVGLPFAPTVELFRQCDLNRLEVLAWREQRAEQVRAWEKAGGKP
jgi:hypothetical protein